METHFTRQWCACIAWPRPWQAEASGTGRGFWWCSLGSRAYDHAQLVPSLCCVKTIKLCCVQSCQDLPGGLSFCDVPVQRCWRHSTKRLLWDNSVAGGSQVQKCVEVDIKCITAVSVSPAPQWLVAHCEGHGWRGARRDIASAADWRAEFVTRPLMSQLYYMLTSPHGNVPTQTFTVCALRQRKAAVRAREGWCLARSRA